MDPSRRAPRHLWAGLLPAIFALDCAAPPPPASSPEVVVPAVSSAQVLELAPLPSSPWKVGAYLSLTGAEAEFGIAAKEGIELAAAEANERGGVKGRALGVAFADDASSPQGAVNEILKLIDRDKVVVLLGSVSSSRSRAGGIVANKKRIPMLSPTATNPEVTRTGPFVFRACFTDDVQGKVAAAFAVTTRKQTRVAILYAPDELYSTLLADTFRKEALRLGAVVVEEQRFARSETDFTKHLQPLHAAAPDVIFAPVYYDAMARIAPQARRIGLRGEVFLGGDGWDADTLLKEAGAELEGATFVSHWAIDDPSPASRAFVSGYRRRFKHDPNSVAALAYEATGLLADALGRSRDGTPDGIRAALQETSGFQGITGSITMGPDRDPIKSATLVKIQGGHFAYHASVSAP